MSENLDQNDIDSLMNQVQQGNATLADAAKAVTQAQQTAGEIAGDIQSMDARSPAADGASPAEGAAVVYPADVQRLLALEVPVIVQLGTRRMNVGEVMRFAVGAIIEFSKSAEEELELLVNNKPIGKGHAVKVGENFGLKLSVITPVKETIRKLGAA